jgi:hypothetical protein
MDEEVDKYYIREMGELIALDMENEVVEDRKRNGLPATKSIQWLYCHLHENFPI